MSVEKQMTIEEACRKIMGAKLADAIIKDRGVHWAVVAAMGDATDADDPTAIAVIRQWAKDGTTRL